MKKIFAVIIFISFLASLSAEENNHTFYLGASIGILDGRSEFIVYRSSNSKDYLSELLWEIKPLTYVGADIRYVWQDESIRWGIFANSSIKFGFSGTTGLMEDRDWMDDVYQNFLTHYSVHENSTEDSVLIDINAGVSFKIFDIFLLKPFLSYSFMRFSWAASGGSFLYPPDYDPEHAYLIQPIDVITFTQTWHMLSLGINFFSGSNPYFDVEAGIKLSPLVWCSSEDNHILRDLIISSDLFLALLFEPSLQFTFKNNDFSRISLIMKYRYISGLRGDSEYRENGILLSDIPGNIGGTGFSAFEIGLVFHFLRVMF